MEGIICILIAIFILYAIYVYKKTCSVNTQYINEFCDKEQGGIRYDVEIENNIAILNSNSNSVQKAMAIISLMKYEYILIHIQRNRGEKYSDQKQSEKFKRNMTPKTINVIFNLEGKYE